MNIKQHIQEKREEIEDLPSFIGKASDLLTEGYTLNESLLMLLPYYTKYVQRWQYKIKNVIDEGYGAAEIFKCLKVSNEFLLAIYFAERHGNLGQTLTVISEQMRYKKQMATQIKKLLAYPLFMFILLISFFIGFRLYFLPNISQLLLTRGTEDLSTVQISRFLLHIPDYFLLLGISITFISIFILYYLRKKHINLRLRYFMKIPVINTFYKLNLTRQIARNLGNLLLAGFSLQQAIQELKSQYFKPDIQYIAEKIEEQVIFGHSLSDIIADMPYFFARFDLFVRHGEHNGLLGRELILYCDILDEKLKSYLTKVLAIVQPLCFVIIAICIMAAYLSILLPMYKMIDVV